MPASTKLYEDRTDPYAALVEVGNSPVENESSNDPALASGPEDGPLLIAHASHVKPPDAKSVGTGTPQNISPHEEALRYLLHHLKEIKNKA